MARFVKILKVERVIPNLIHRGTLENRFADFELHDEDHGANKDDCINAASHAGNVELQE